MEMIKWNRNVFWVKKFKTLDTRVYRLNYGRSDDINEQKLAIFVYV